MEPTKGKYLPQLDIIRACAFIFVVLLHYSVPTWDAITNKLGTITESLIRGGGVAWSVFVFVRIRLFPCAR
jgi:peptidoglycan/LPS O-acetylase OafA/YrhL